MALFLHIYFASVYKQLIVGIIKCMRMSLVSIINRLAIRKGNPSGTKFLSKARYLVACTMCHSPVSVVDVDYSPTKLFPKIDVSLLWSRFQKKRLCHCPILSSNGMPHRIQYSSSGEESIWTNKFGASTPSVAHDQAALVTF